MAVRVAAAAAQAMMTSTQRRARRVKMIPSPTRSTSNRQTASNATWPQAMNKIAAIE